MFQNDKLFFFLFIYKHILYFHHLDGRICCCKTCLYLWKSPMTPWALPTPSQILLCWNLCWRKRSFSSLVGRIWQPLCSSWPEPFRSVNFIPNHATITRWKFQVFQGFFFFSIQLSHSFLAPSQLFWNVFKFRMHVHFLFEHWISWFCAVIQFYISLKGFANHCTVFIYILLSVQTFSSQLFSNGLTRWWGCCGTNQPHFLRPADWFLPVTESISVLIGTTD